MSFTDYVNNDEPALRGRTTEEIFDEFARFIKACGDDRGVAVRTLKGEVPPPPGWEAFVTASQARRQAREGVR